MTLPLPIETLRKYASPSGKQPSVLAGLSDEQLEQVVRMIGNKSFSDRDIAKQIQRTFKVGLDRSVGTIRNAVLKLRHKIREHTTTPDEIARAEKRETKKQVDSDWRKKREELKNKSILEQQQALILDLWEDFKLWREFTTSSDINPKHVVDLGRLLKDAMTSYVESLDKFGLIQKQNPENAKPHTQINQLLVMFNKNITDPDRMQDFLLDAQNQLEQIAESDEVPQLTGDDYAAELQPEIRASDESPGIDTPPGQGSGSESQRARHCSEVPILDSDG
jgi:hypothetical protein